MVVMVTTILPPNGFRPNQTKTSASNVAHRSLSCASNGAPNLSVAQAVAEQCPFSCHQVFCCPKKGRNGRFLFDRPLCCRYYLNVRQKIVLCLALLMVPSTCLQHKRLRSNAHSPVLTWVLPFGDAVESAPALQLSLCSQVAKFSHHLQAGHVQVGQRLGRLGGPGWCSLEQFPSRPPWSESNLGYGQDGSAVEST